MWPLTVLTLLTSHPLVFVRPLSPFVLCLVFSCSLLHAFPFCIPLSVLSFLCFKHLSPHLLFLLLSHLLSLTTYLLSLLLTSTFLSPLYSPLYNTFTHLHSDVTKVLTYLAQASHDLVPPEVSHLRRYISFSIELWQASHVSTLYCRTGFNCVV